MSLTKEMISHVQENIKRLDNELLIVYYNTYKKLNSQSGNFYWKFQQDAAFEEILNRGIEDENTM